MLQFIMTTKKVVVDAPRAFKTAWFSKAAAKVGITDAELCAAFHDLLGGRGDDLGGSVYKRGSLKTVIDQLL